MTVEKLGEASTPDQVIRIFDKALGEIGAEYHAILLFPLPDEQIDDGVISWKAPSVSTQKEISSTETPQSGNAVVP